MIIGLTGGIASGKSTVATMLKEYGLPIVDADVVAREVVEVGEETYEKLVSEFGEGILKDDRSLDRAKLGKLIFENKEKREILNSIMHPSIRNRMKEATNEYLEKGHQTVVMDIPLLFESKLTHLVEKTLLVYVDEEVQLERLMRRNDFSREDAMARISSQMPLRDKVGLADAVIQNNGTIGETKEQLNKLLTEWAIPI